jgi:hypothetical protein
VTHERSAFASAARMATFVIVLSLETSKCRRWVWQARLNRRSSDPSSTALPLSRRVVAAVDVNLSQSRSLCFRSCEYIMQGSVLLRGSLFLSSLLVFMDVLIAVSYIQSIRHSRSGQQYRARSLR